MYDQVFMPYTIGKVALRNRLTLAPLYLGYAGERGAVSKLFLEHYRLMARSGVALVVVENATIDYGKGRGSPRTLRVDTDDCLEGLAELAAAIQAEGALASLQINHVSVPIRPVHESDSGIVSVLPIHEEITERCVTE